VQQAKVPPLRKFSPAVPPELEAVVHRALAADPAQRYQSARDLGRDLNKMLFHIGREVSSFDIAQLVLPIWRERNEKRARPVSNRQSIIGTLIDEALIEFTSLQDRERRSMLSNPGAMPLSVGAFDGQNWAKDLGLSLPAPTRIDVAPHGIEVGNLASLEDDPISAPPPPGAAHRAPTTDSSLPPSSAPGLSSAMTRTSRGAVIGLAVALGLLVTAVVIYLAG